MTAFALHRHEQSSTPCRPQTTFPATWPIMNRTSRRVKDGESDGRRTWWDFPARPVESSEAGGTTASSSETNSSPSLLFRHTRHKSQRAGSTADPVKSIPTQNIQTESIGTGRDRRGKQVESEGSSDPMRSDLTTSQRNSEPN